jgi:hypothetical protein
MKHHGLTGRREGTTGVGMKRLIALTCTLSAGGCINVTAPNKPIEINLNISVTAETVVKLDTQAKTLIQQNPGIF